MERFTGIIGIVIIFSIAFLFSNNRKAINYRLVASGLALQLILAILVLKVPGFIHFFQWLGKGMQHLEQFAKQGANFVFSGIATIDTSGTAQNYASVPAFIFAFNVTATIILVCILATVFYHVGIMQPVISLLARVMNAVMRVSGAEALSNVASAFVGQVEAQVLIRPYLTTMTKSELLASMSGSLACISGGILIVYTTMGAKAEYLIMASLMAAPGALVISKIVFPETEKSLTKGGVKLEIKSQSVNLIDAISKGATEGFKISMNVIAALIGFIALIACLNWILNYCYTGLTLDVLFGKLFYPIAWTMGIPTTDVTNAATLLGQKLTINEFIAFKSLTTQSVPILTEKGLLIVSIAICGFANFSSIGMQIGGIGALVPERRSELAKLGMRALLCGTLASYLSAALAGIVF